MAAIRMAKEPAVAETPVAGMLIAKRGPSVAACGSVLLHVCGESAVCLGAVNSPDDPSEVEPQTMRPADRPSISGLIFSPGPAQCRHC
jgi:hypothetical protein